jgi:hypothetical protein
MLLDKPELGRRLLSGMPDPLSIRDHGDVQDRGRRAIDGTGAEVHEPLAKVPILTSISAERFVESADSAEHLRPDREVSRKDVRRHDPSFWCGEPVVTLPVKRNALLSERRDLLR